MQQGEIAIRFLSTFLEWPPLALEQSSGAPLGIILSIDIPSITEFRVSALRVCCGVLLLLTLGALRRWCSRFPDKAPPSIFSNDKGRRCNSQQRVAKHTFLEFLLLGPRVIEHALCFGQCIAVRLQRLSR